MKVVSWTARNNMDVHVTVVLGKIGKSDMEPVHLQLLQHEILDRADHIPHHPLFLDIQVIELRNVAARSNHGVAGSKRRGVRQRDSVLAEDPGVIGRDRAKRAG